MSGKKQKLVFCVLLFSAGCGMKAQPSISPVEESKTAKASVANTSDTEIVHDFGMLKPDERVSHDFVIANPSDKDWTLVNIAQSCSCSVAEASSQTIKAGGKETFKFDYHAPSKSADERRWVTVTFKDPAEHSIKLIATAYVRAPMLPRNSSLNFGNMGLGSSAQRSLDVGNFSATAWSELSLFDAPKWLTLRRAVKTQRKWSGAAPFESWSLDLEVATASLKPGAYREEVRFRSNLGETANIPVEFVAGIPVQARPSLFMLGQTESSIPVEATTTLRFFGGSAPCSPDQLEISAKGAKVVGKSIKVLKNDLWKLTAQLEPVGIPGEFISGELTVAFPMGNPSDILIPIHAQIRPSP